MVAKQSCTFVSLKAGKDLILQLVKPSPFGEGFTNIHLPASLAYLKNTLYEKGEKIKSFTLGEAA